MPDQKRIWDIIANYESSDLVSARYFAKHGRRPNAAHAREITAPFIQGRQYYSAVASADKAVKPLLLYYGVVSLSRGLVLFLTRNCREAALAQSHGLSIRDWQTVLNAAPPDISDLQITVNGAGSFVELLRATGNRSLLRAGSSRVNQQVSQGSVPTGTLFTFGELLARLPDLLEQFKHWKIPRCIMFSVNGSNIIVPRSGYVNEELVLDIVGRAYCDLISVDANNIVVKSRSDDIIGAMLTDRIAGNLLDIGDLVLAQRYVSGADLAKIAQLFAMSYILSMLVRYYPAFWMDLVRQRIGDAPLPSIFRAIDCIETLFPQIVVDFLEE